MLRTYKIFYYSPPTNLVDGRISEMLRTETITCPECPLCEILDMAKPQLGEFVLNSVYGD